MVVAALVMLMTVGMVQTGEATTRDGNKYGVGFQMLGDVWGASFQWDVGRWGRTQLNPLLIVDPDMGPGMRLRYAFYNPRFLDIYAEGGVMYINDLYGTVSAGIEWDWRSIDRKLPPISWSVEIGLYGSTDPDIAFGIHLTF